MERTEQGFWGTPPDRKRHWVIFVGGYAGLIVGLMMLAFLLGTIESVRPWVSFHYYRVIQPAITFVSPFFVSAVSTHRDGGLLVSLVIGIVPALSWGGFLVIGEALRTYLFGLPEVSSGGPGGLPIIFPIAAFAIYGLGLAMLGFVAGWAIPIVQARLRGVF